MTNFKFTAPKRAKKVWLAQVMGIAKEGQFRYDQNFAMKQFGASGVTFITTATEGLFQLGVDNERLYFVLHDGKFKVVNRLLFDSYAVSGKLPSAALRGWNPLSDFAAIAADHIDIDYTETLLER